MAPQDPPDDVVAEMLKADARNNELRYARIGLGELLPKRYFHLLKRNSNYLLISRQSDVDRPKTKPSIPTQRSQGDRRSQHSSPSCNGQRTGRKTLSLKEKHHKRTCS
jgi:hypothetical protein